MQLIMKVASRCNLNCSYCYVYNKEDTTWRHRPPLMSDAVFTAALQRTREYCAEVDDNIVNLVFHGGEPCLIGVERFRQWCQQARDDLSALNVNLSMQSNGTLIDDRWVDAFKDHSIGVGVSMDGPASIHDLYRVNAAGRGSHASVVRALDLLRAADVQHGVLCVIPLGSDPLRVHRHFIDQGVPMVTYLWPDYTHDTVEPLRERFGPTPCADFLIPIFDAWSADPSGIHVRDLWNISRVVLGGTSSIETIGNQAPHYLFVETDGSIEGLDALKACADRLSGTDLNVLSSDFLAVLRAGGLHAQSIFQGMALPDACKGCPEERTCAGGYLPHRYSTDRGFNNPSVWCADLLKLFAHVRRRLDVTPEETGEYRRRYSQIREEAAHPCVPASGGLST